MGCASFPLLYIAAYYFRIALDERATSRDIFSLTARLFRNVFFFSHPPLFLFYFVNGNDGCHVIAFILPFVKAKALSGREKETGNNS